ncbi:acyl-CoA dehydrogenase family protein [Virgisporangium aurantiacum]|uniref:Acyl-CoA dehydrogenase n=1 Tax=Virgisporangium aurantiacum TaxID=175570 RepID=A0A8J3ZJW8_9ACTN|nr:acyl-CoA dehydrogenase family protein [Virgisporangium aurantiacum]GIJ63330.1 acyl-CoA dehydrogenase [Virgisporangium aurantiacum]
MTEYRAALQAVLDEEVRPHAAEVDRTGDYPRSAVTALGAAGLLGLTSAREVGGAGLGLDAAAEVIEGLAGVCGSTAMVVLMHYAATAAVELHGPEDVRRAIAAGRHVTTLAFSEQGSRSHFWVPRSTATANGDKVTLNARKSWVTSAGEADSYVWSSRPLSGDGMTLWLVPSATAGLTVAGPFDGVGLRGNASRPVTATDAVLPADALLGEDGAGLDIALGVVLPVFTVLSAAFSQGVMERLTALAAEHLTHARLDHLGQTLAEQPVARAAFARVRTSVDTARAFLTTTLAALAGGDPAAQLRVLQVKAVAGETAVSVADEVMRLAGGAAFRKELGIERHFRDALAARVMAPTTDALNDFVGRAVLGLPLFDAPAVPDAPAVSA